MSKAGEEFMIAVIDNPISAWPSEIIHIRPPTPHKAWRLQIKINGRVLIVSYIHFYLVPSCRRESEFLLKRINFINPVDLQQVLMTVPKKTASSDIDAFTAEPVHASAWTGLGVCNSFHYRWLQERRHAQTRSVPESMYSRRGRWAGFVILEDSSRHTLHPEFRRRIMLRGGSTVSGQAASSSELTRVPRKEWGRASLISTSAKWPIRCGSVQWKLTTRLHSVRPLSCPGSFFE